MTMRDVRTPDLEMRVRTLTEHGRTRLTYTLHSPSGVVPFVHREIAGPALQGSPEDFQRNLLRKIEKIAQRQDVDGSRLSSADADRKLASLGRDLWRELIPPELCQAYREIRRSSVRSWMIVSDEPWIPWELIKPYDASLPGEILDDEFLTLQFELTRWLAGDKAPAHRIEVRQLAAFVTATDLPHAEEERSVLTEIAQSNPALWDATPGAGSAGEALDFLETAKVELLHFIGHGFHSVAQPEESGIPFPDDSVFRPVDLGGPLATHIARTRPLVFLNVCGAGQQGRSLTSLGGWAARWVGACGCGAFVAPMWPVRDEAALSFAWAFYAALEAGAALGQAALEARQKVARERPGDPSALAYAVYGHPAARVQFDGGSAAEEPSPHVEAPRVRRVRRSPRRRQHLRWIGPAAVVVLAGILSFTASPIVEFFYSEDSPPPQAALPARPEKPESDPAPPPSSTRSASAPADRAPTPTSKTTAGGLRFEIAGGRSSLADALRQALTREAKLFAEEGFSSSGWTIAVELSGQDIRLHNKGGLDMLACRLTARASARGPGVPIDLGWIESVSSQFDSSRACQAATGPLAETVLTRFATARQTKGEP